MVSAIPETEFIHLPNHVESAAFAFCLTLREKTEVRDFGRNEQHRRGIWASGHASAAPNAGGGFHGKIRDMLGDRQSVGFGSGTGSNHDVTASFDDPIKSAAVDHQILDRREGGRAERFDPDRVSVGELPHIKLASGPFAGSVRDTIDDQGAGSANAFAAVRIKGDRIFAAIEQGFVDDIEHLKKRGFRRNIFRVVIF